MKKTIKLNQFFNVKNIVKAILIILFALSYVGYMKIGCEVCEIDKIYCIYFCVGLLAYKIFKYLYNLTANYLLINEKKDGESV